MNNTSLESSILSEILGGGGNELTTTTILQKINKISSTKLSLKSEIERLGIDLTNIPFNKYPSKLQEGVSNRYNPLAIEHYIRVIQDGGVIYCTLRELSDWFDREGITRSEMDDSSEFKLIRVDPYYTGVRVDGTSTEEITYVNKVYSISERFDMIQYSVSGGPIELTRDYYLRRDINEKNRGIKTLPLGFYFNDLYYSVTAIAEEFDVKQLPAGHYPNICPIIGTFTTGVSSGFYYTYTSENVVDLYMPKIMLRNGTEYLQDMTIYRKFTPGEEFKTELLTSDFKSSFFVNGEKVTSHPTNGLIESDFLSSIYYDPIGIVVVQDKGYNGGTPMGGSVKFKDFKFRFKEYIDPSTTNTLPLDEPRNEPFSDKEIRYLEELEGLNPM